MVFLGMFFVAASVGAFCISLGLVPLPDRAVRRRLLDDERIAQAKPTGKRLKLVDAPTEISRLVVTPHMLGRIERQLMVAGHPAGWTMQHIVVAKMALPPLVGLLVAPLVLTHWGVVSVVLGASAMLVGYVTPDLLLYSRGIERRDRMQRDLPDLLDKMVISIEAGLSFEAALAKTAESSAGPLADEFLRTIQDIRLGVARRDAYASLQARTTSEDLHAFIRAMVQAEEHGSSVSSTVRIQSKEMRTKRRLRAEAKAGSVSVKLMGPLMGCIFPVLFVVVLAPAIISAFNTF